MLDHTILTVFVLGCIALVVGALAFFAKSWMKTLNDTIHELSLSVQDLTSIVAGLKQEQALQNLKLKHQAEELKRIQLLRGCSKDDCPFKHMFNVRSGDLTTGANLTEDDLRRISQVIAAREHVDDSA